MFDDIHLHVIVARSYTSTSSLLYDSLRCPNIFPSRGLPLLLYPCTLSLCPPSYIKLLSSHLLPMLLQVQPGARTINVFRACLGAQLTICAQKWHNFVLLSTVSLRFVLSRVCVFLCSLGPWTFFWNYPYFCFIVHLILSLHILSDHILTALLLSSSLFIFIFYFIGSHAFCLVSSILCATVIFSSGILLICSSYVLLYTIWFTKLLTRFKYVFINCFCFHLELLTLWCSAVGRQSKCLAAPREVHLSAGGEKVCHNSCNIWSCPYGNGQRLVVEGWTRDSIENCTDMHGRERTLTEKCVRCTENTQRKTEAQVVVCMQERHGTCNLDRATSQIRIQTYTDDPRWCSNSQKTNICCVLNDQSFNHWHRSGPNYMFVLCLFCAI